MKKYRSHKIVEADKIKAIEDDVVSLLIFDTPPAHRVSYTWMQKHSPEVGGYFVRYADGYESYSPADAFESGYTEVA